MPRVLVIVAFAPVSKSVPALICGETVTVESPTTTVGALVITRVPWPAFANTVSPAPPPCRTVPVITESPRLVHVKVREVPSLLTAMEPSTVTMPLELFTSAGLPFVAVLKSPSDPLPQVAP